MNVMHHPRTLIRTSGTLVAVLLACLLAGGPSLANECHEPVTGTIRLEPHHPWRPPFDLERVSSGLTAIVELQVAERPLREYWLSSFSQGKEVERKIVALAGIFAKPPFVGRATFAQPFDELALFA